MLPLLATPVLKQPCKITTGDSKKSVTSDKEEKKLQHCVVRKREVIRLSRHERRKRCAISLDLSLILDILIKGSYITCLECNCVLN